MWHDATPSPKLGPRWASASKMRKYGDLRVRSQHSALKGVEGVLRLWDRTRKRDKLIHSLATYNKTNHKLVSSPWRTLLVLGQATGNTDSLDSPRLELGGGHQFPPYNILCVIPPHPRPNGFLSWDSQSGVPKLSQFGLPRLCDVITSRSDLRSGRGLKQNCSFP